MASKPSGFRALQAQGFSFRRRCRSPEPRSGSYRVQGPFRDWGCVVFRVPFGLGFVSGLRFVVRGLGFHQELGWVVEEFFRDFVNGGRKVQGRFWGM